MIVTTVTIITSGHDTDSGETHHNVEVRATEGAPPEAVQRSVEDGCLAAIKVSKDSARPSVTEEREQDFESGSQQEG